jgi:pimeloyl-ACP methyl ester carboxylesterase
MGAPIILIGHSWGGYSVLDAAKYAVDRGIPIDLLVTVDPVDGPVRSFNSVTSENILKIKKALGGKWVNLRATRYQTHPEEWTPGDVIADWGKKFVDQSKADVPLVVDVHHEDFRSMMKAANIEGRVSNIYKEYRRRKMK